jgi:hypothetical protein
VPSAKPSRPPDGGIEYKRLDTNRVLVIAKRPGKKPLKTIVEVFRPEELEEPINAPMPQGK